MISELDRKILTKACGLESDKYWFCLKCYKELPWTHVTYKETCTKCGSLVIEKGGIPDFTAPDDWELVRVKVVVPNMIEYSRYMALTFIRGDAYSVMLWMSKQTPENLCESVIEFIKSCPDLFPWAEMMEEKK